MPWKFIREIFRKETKFELPIPSMKVYYTYTHNTYVHIIRYTRAHKRLNQLFIHGEFNKRWSASGRIQMKVD